ncbi:uncharacterized protein GGS22DRAFT_193221 [Annulohypoxylon maeteangense]|uniref:uncharacterized protein n=1 Tax=Annulohypoxylon maeteangense TaxID=1927788 RepID=UPI0020077410|nr:uncharacterized protein GGS22DRAFT_193221 [Annulohypoxylon maeteangense]KAI0880450.1 hypothetical protein GGS22DRAFT_193221 [Annulohypoxylon maeteangense]
MPSTTESQKSQTSSPDNKISQESDNKDPGSDSNTKQKRIRSMTKEDINKLFQEAYERNSKMSPEEEAKAYPWLKQCREAVPVTANEVPDLWDEI